MEFRERFRRGRTVDMSITGHKGTGKSLAALHFLLKYDVDASYWDVIIPLQVSANMVITQRNMAKWSVWYDIMNVVEKLRVNEWIGVEEVFRKYREFLESSPQTHFERGGVTYYYMGWSTAKLREEFDIGLENLSKLGYVDYVGEKLKWTGKRRGIKVFVFDETQKEHGEGAIITQDALKNMVNVARTKGFSFIFVGLEYRRGIKYDFMLETAEAYADPKEPHKLIYTKLRVWAPSVYEAGKYKYIGCLLVRSPPDEIIRVYLEKERELSASSTLGSMGMFNPELLRVYQEREQFRNLMLNTPPIDVQDFVDELVRDPNFQELVSEKLIWSKVEAYVRKKLREEYDVPLNHQLWMDIRLELESRGYRK